MDYITQRDGISAQRYEKWQHWVEAGRSYPNDFRPTVLAQELHQAYSDAALELPTTVYEVAGRLRLKRVMGKASFYVIQDASGSLQIYLHKQTLGDETYDACKEWDLGDILGVSGTLFWTKTGELTLLASTIQLLVKSLRVLPDKWHGLNDIEQRYRHRYLDLLFHDEVRERFKTRSQIIALIRQQLTENGFLEVETPMMQVLPGGAAARPFLTHHNALDMPLYLRIAPELFLKRLVVGGIERVFELNRNFRNEGISSRHNPEFTMLEVYQSYADYKDAMNLAEGLIVSAARSARGTLQFAYQGRPMDFTPPFKRLSLVQALANHFGCTETELQDRAALKRLAQQAQVNLAQSTTLGAMQLCLFEECVEKTLFDPVFVTHYPIEVSPLSKAFDSDLSVAERFELFIGGRELANGFSELNDPVEQASRFQKQADAKAAGDDEAMFFDSDYVEALEYGLPPTAGLGIGIDRLIMLLTDSASIRDVILFPLLRPTTPNPSPDRLSDAESETLATVQNLLFPEVE